MAIIPINQIMGCSMSFFSKIFGSLSKNSQMTPKINLNNYQFISSDHIRYENGIDHYGHQKGANRGITVVKHESISDAFNVTMYNLDGNHPIGGVIQMAPKRMKIVSQSDSKIVLRGFGNDSFGASFSNYGLTIYLNGSGVEKVMLHMYDRNIDIEYFK